MDTAESSGHHSSSKSKSTWAVACLTLQDWEQLTEKYKSSKSKSDRELYETLSESFLPEIVKMFAEKDREEKRRLLMLQPKRTSNRIERKRREQEERDRQLAIKLEEERRLEEDYDAKLREEREKEEELLRERAREDRIKQRELVKMQREHRAIEREMGKGFMEKLEQNEAAIKVSVIVPPAHSFLIQYYSFLYLLQSRELDAEDSPDEQYVPPKQEEAESESDDSSYSPSAFGGGGGSGGESGPNAANAHRKKKDRSEKKKQRTFANALLRVGTKSTRDCSLDKPIQKRPGRLLETAGRSLLQKSASNASGGGGSSFFAHKPPASSLLLGGGESSSNSPPYSSPPSSASATGSGIGGSSASSNYANNAFNALAFSSGTKLSFGLYGGHLPVDHGGYTKSGDANPNAANGAAAISAILGGGGGGGSSSRSRLEERSRVAAPTSAGSQASLTAPTPNQQQQQPPTKRVFSNWGGEFFKKNLDYRANTNKILEKMNLSSKDGTGVGNSRPVSVALANKSPESAGAAGGVGQQSAAFGSGERFKSLLQTTATSAAKRSENHLL